MRSIFIMFLLLFLTGCTGDNVNKYFVKGGGINRDSYKFNMMEISEISSDGKYSDALFCPANNTNRCMRLGFYGDLTDFEEGQYVNIKVENLKLTEIGSVWFTTRYFYLLPRALSLPHNVSLFISYYILSPIAMLFILGLLVNLIPRRK